MRLNAVFVKGNEGRKLVLPSGESGATTPSKTCFELERERILDLRRCPGVARMDRLAIGPQVGQPAPQRNVFSSQSLG
jgi:hypothetical protein